MYPDGLRQDSSNPNPIYPWNFGVQLVAVNHQTKDDLMALYYGKFRDNGGCGYVLKPKYLIDSAENVYNPLDLAACMHLDILHYVTITIISAQFLSRSVDDRSDIPDPYIMVSTHGLSCDCHSQRTRFVEDNGLNPIWNETFRFCIRFPHMCIVRFDVYDYDVFSRDDRLAYFSLPMLTMQTGRRSNSFSTLPTGFAGSFRISSYSFENYWSSIHIFNIICACLDGYKAIEHWSQFGTNLWSF